MGAATRVSYREYALEILKCIFPLLLMFYRLLYVWAALAGGSCYCCKVTATRISGWV